jgi:hypothetical protein
MKDPVQKQPAYFEVDYDEYGKNMEVCLDRTIRGGSCNTEQIRPHLHLFNLRLGEPMWMNDPTDGFRIVRNL